MARALSAFAKNREELDFSVSELADELWRNRGQSLVLAGGMAADGDFGVQLQVAANFLNSILENDGKTIETGKNVVRASGNVSDLIEALNKKQISTLIIHGSNPVYSLPEQAGFTDALKNAEMVITTADRNDETSRLADYVATDHHALENWGDMQSLDGTVSIQQPTIQPLHNTRAFQDSMLAWMKLADKGSAKAKAAKNWYDYLFATWGMSQDQWVELLQAGVKKGAPVAGGSRSLASGTLIRLSRSRSVRDLNSRFTKSGDSRRAYVERSVVARVAGSSDQSVLGQLRLHLAKRFGAAEIEARAARDLNGR